MIYFYKFYKPYPLILCYYCKIYWKKIRKSMKNNQNLLYDKENKKDLFFIIEKNQPFL